MSTRLVLICLLSSACAILGPSERDIAYMRANTRTEKFIKPVSAWLCTTAQQALMGARCELGFEIRNNRTVTVLGEEPKAGVWPVVYEDAQGTEHRLFVAAAALNEQPDTLELEAFAIDVSRRYPDEARIPLGSVNATDLIEQRVTHRGRVVVIRHTLRDLMSEEFANGVFSFTIPMPLMAGSRQAAPVPFVLENAMLVDDYKHGGHAYECGPHYCDEFVIVAELARRTEDYVDELGGHHRVPVFAVRELGDRYGTYKSP